MRIIILILVLLYLIPHTFSAKKPLRYCRMCAHYFNPWERLGITHDQYDRLRQYGTQDTEIYSCGETPLDICKVCCDGKWKECLNTVYGCNCTDVCRF